MKLDTLPKTWFASYVKSWNVTESKTVISSKPKTTDYEKWKVDIWRYDELTNCNNLNFDQLTTHQLTIWHIVLHVYTHPSHHNHKFQFSSMHNCHSYTVSMSTQFILYQFNAFHIDSIDSISTLFNSYRLMSFNHTHQCNLSSIITNYHHYTQFINPNWKILIAIPDKLRARKLRQPR